MCSAAVDSGVCASFWIMVFSGYMPSSGISGSDVSKYFQVIPEKCKNLSDITSNVTIILFLVKPFICPADVLSSF